MMRRPPRSTLCRYTALFRSATAGLLAAVDEVVGHGAGGGGPGEIDLATAGGRRGQVGGGGRGRRRLGGGAGGIGVRAQAAGSAGLDPIGVALGGEEPGVHEGGAGRGPDLGEVAAAGLLAALDEVAGHGAGGGGPGEIDLATASGRRGQVGGGGRGAGALTAGRMARPPPPEICWTS